VSFDIAPGEVVGVTGLLGAGQEALPGLLAGVAPRRGSVRVWEAELPAGDLQAALDAGVALVPADRRRDGLWAEGSVAENLGIGAPGRWNRARERRSAPELIARFGVRPADPSLPIRALSGGNQQKVLLAKWLQRDPRVVLLHEPTQGVDVAAKREIHRIVREFATRTGAAVCLVSSDHEETADACDRVLVMAGGRITGELAGAELSPNRILATANAA
jgi:ribose transport system ATP-binding protein